MTPERAVRLWWASLDDATRAHLRRVKDAPLPPQLIACVATSEPLQRGGVVPAGSVWSQTRIGYRYYLPSAVLGLLAELDE